MKHEAILIAAARAPKKPDDEILDDWEVKFRADYPKPEALGRWELMEASRAVEKAKCPVSITDLRRYIPSDLEAWKDWREECLEKFIRDEWPIVWAKRIAAAIY